MAEVVIYKPNGQKVKPAPPSFEIGRVDPPWAAIYGAWDANPDMVVRQQGHRKVLEYEKDPHLKAQLYTRKQNLISKGWRIVPPWERRYSPNTSGAVVDDPKMPEKIALINWIIDEHIDNFAADLMGIMDSYGKGFSLSEIVWERAERGPFTGAQVVKGIHKKPWENLRFQRDEFGHVVHAINTVDNNRQIPLDNFIHAVFGPDDENPYGEGLTPLSAFYVWLKKNHVKYWAIFGEKYSMPITIAKMPKGKEKDDEAKAIVDDFLKNLQTQSGFRIPEGFVVELLEAKRQGDVSYDGFIERCNKEISKLVLGQTLSSEEGKRGQGSHALGQAHLTTLDIYVFFDMLLNESVINRQLIRRIMDYNYFDGIYPHFEFVNTVNWTQFAQAVLNLTTSGLALPASWVYRTANIPEPGPDDTVIQREAVSMPPDNEGVDNGAMFSGFGPSRPAAAMLAPAQPDRKSALFVEHAPKTFSDTVTSILYSTIERALKTIKSRLPAGTSCNLEDIPKYSLNMSDLKNYLIRTGILEMSKAAGKRLSGRERRLAGVLFEQGAYDTAGEIRGVIEKDINDVLLELADGWDWAMFRETLGKKQISSGGLDRLEEALSAWRGDVRRVIKQAEEDQ